MAIRAVLFDLDGTLLNTLDDIADSMNAALLEMGENPWPIENYKLFVGDGVKVLVERVLPEGRRDAATVERGMSCMSAQYQRRWANKSKPYDGIPELLNALVSRGITMGILSNKPHAFTLVVVEKLLAGWTFNPVMGSKPNVPNKPNPAAALDILHQSGIPAEEFLFVGDTEMDIKTALGAGMVPVGVRWGFRSEKELVDAGAKVVLDHPLDLLKLLAYP